MKNIGLFIFPLILFSCVIDKTKMTAKLTKLPNRDVWNIYVLGDTVLYETKQKYSFDSFLNPIKIDNQTEKFTFKYFFVFADSICLIDTLKKVKQNYIRNVCINLNNKEKLKLYDSFDENISGCSQDTVLNNEMDMINKRLFKIHCFKRSVEFRNWYRSRQNRCKGNVPSSRR